ncbi:hypothetical protein PVAP13_2NG492300 [Panicum virgatum]|uniref:Uncharacterized protein n=1 Tax=Panicum virgatum TaxID=38727 RepID=A0A8T0VPS8_PANVG|nr:hypothetical protein PVAP13_2NG492300 [Panicum virgatum]
MPAADLVGHLIRRNRRASDFVDVALVLAARERRLAEAEARAFAGGRDEHREVAREDEQHGFEGAGIGAPSSLKMTTGPALAPSVLQAELHGDGTEVGIVGIADLTGHEGEAQAEEDGRRREEAPLQVASGKRKESAAASSEGHRWKKLKLRAWGGRCSNAVSESEANTRDESESESEAEDAWDDQYALAIVPDGCDLPVPEASPEIGDVPRTPSEPKHGGGGTDMSVQVNHESEDLVALAVVAPGQELPPPAGGVEERGVKEAGGRQKPEVAWTAASAFAQWRGDSGDEPKNGVLDMEGSPAPEPEASEKCSATAVAANGPPRKKGTFYKMVFKALKEKERQAALAKPATASEPSLRCWLYAPLPKESVAKEGGS